MTRPTTVTTTPAIPASHGPPVWPSSPLVACRCWFALEVATPWTTLYAVQAKPGVEHRTAGRHHPLGDSPRAVFVGMARRGLEQLPDRQGDQTDRDDPDEHTAERLRRQDLESAGLVALGRWVARRELYARARRPRDGVHRSQPDPGGSGCAELDCYRLCGWRVGPWSRRRQDWAYLTRYPRGAGLTRPR